MKNIWKKIWDFLNQKNHMLIAILIAVLISLIGIMYLQHNRIANLKDKYQAEVKLKDALIDKVSYYQNKEKEWVAEKLTIQTSIKNLEKMNSQLTDMQKDLLNRVKEIDKKNSIITAALIKTNIQIDSLLHKGDVVVDTANKKVTYVDSTEYLKYNIVAGNVLPAHPDVKPTLEIVDLTLPNEQFVEFHWKNDKKKGYPIAFSVSNSNKYIKTVDIESYAIPELNKQVVNPNGWQKIGNFFKRTGKTIGKVGTGIAIGATAVYLIMK